MSRGLVPFPFPALTGFQRVQGAGNAVQALEEVIPIELLGGKSHLILVSRHPDIGVHALHSRLGHHRLWLLSGQREGEQLSPTPRPC